MLWKDATTVPWTLQVQGNQPPKLHRTSWDVQNTTPIHIYPTQSINSAMVEGPSDIDNLVSDQRNKRSLQACIDNISSLKTTPFLAFQTDQNKHERPRPTCQTFCRILPPKKLFELKRVSQSCPHKAKKEIEVAPTTGTFLHDEGNPHSHDKGKHLLARETPYFEASCELETCPRPLPKWKSTNEATNRTSIPTAKGLSKSQL